MSGKMMFAMILVDIVIFALVWFIFTKIRDRKRPKDDKGYDPFYFEDESLVLNNPLENGVVKWQI